MRSVISSHRRAAGSWMTAFLVVILAAGCSGQGVVTEGKLNGQGEFVAHTVLAKHDENYMPPEVADALKKAGKSPSGANLGEADQEPAL